MKCYIHIGMHKTGTTSIQSALSKLVSDEFHYLKLDGPNHSIVLRTLFGSELYGHPALRRDGYASADAVQAYREKWLAAFDSQVAAVEKNLVISAEDLSLEGSREILENLKARLYPKFNDFHVIAYIRSPASYTESAFQEVVKSSDAFFKPRLHFPKYRRRFEPVEEVFGKSAVNYIVFDKDELFEGDAVKDFFKRIGVGEHPEDIVEENRSLSLAALSAVYKFRLANRGAISLSASDNRKLISIASMLSGEKFRFSSEVLEPLFDEFGDEVAWMESRLGRAILDFDPQRVGIGAEDDLISVCREQGGRLTELYRSLCHDASLEPLAFALLACSRDFAQKNVNMEIQSEVPIFSEQFLEELRAEDVAPHVALRELAASLCRLGAKELGLIVIERALALNPDGEALKKVKKMLEES